MSSPPPDFSRINRVPHGLQNMLGNTFGGKNPSLLAPDVQSMFDIWPLWGVERVEGKRDTVTTTPVRGNLVDIKVPRGVVWIPFLFSWGINGANNAGDRFEMALRADGYPEQTNPNTPMFIESGDPWTADQVGDIHYWNHRPAFPVAYDSGVNFEAVLQAANAGAGNITLELNIHVWELTR